MELSSRIERVYLHLEDATSPRGARSWFARRARVTPWTVTRWLRGDRSFDGAALAVLEMLEAQAGLSHPDPR